MISVNEQLNSLQQKYQYTFTVFTPTYNRANKLHRVYDSLKVQTYRNFEWLIVDDGSTDNTCELVNKWQKEAEFPISYIYKENGGKHTAFNLGVQKAKGELFLTFDSDDTCVVEALERFKYHWDAIPTDKKHEFSAVTCMCKNQHGQTVGNKFPFDCTDSDSLEIVYRYRVWGEKWGFHRTNVLKEYPFTEEIKNTLVPESLVWNKIARKYKTRFVNEYLRTYWMQESSSPSLGSNGNPSRNAIGRQLAHLTTLNEEIDWWHYNRLWFAKAAINYSRYSFHLGISIFKQFQAIRTKIGKTLWLINLPSGYLAYVLGRFGLLKA